MPFVETKLSGRAFLAYPEKLFFLLDELKNRFFLDIPENDFANQLENEKSIDFLTSLQSPIWFGNLVYIPNWTCEKNPYWAATSLENLSIACFESIKDAAHILKQKQRNWASYQFIQFRRSTLIQEALPYINFKAKSFPFEIPKSSIGIFSLLNKTTMLLSAKTSSFLPLGCISFIEDKENPPSRAYLKFQEALIRLQNEKGVFPQKADRCLDLGASPGGWTWVLRELGCEVIAVDRSELSENLMKDPKVEFIKHDAFTLSLEEFAPFDWIFSDVICYPERLLEWIQKIIDKKMTKKMICTIKLQGETDWSIIDAFSSIPNSFIQHLCYNKHELCWFYCE